MGPAVTVGYRRHGRLVHVPVHQWGGAARTRSLRIGTAPQPWCDGDAVDLRVMPIAVAMVAIEIAIDIGAIVATFDNDPDPDPEFDPDPDPDPDFGFGFDFERRCARVRGAAGRRLKRCATGREVADRRRAAPGGPGAVAPEWPPWPWWRRGSGGQPLTWISIASPVSGSDRCTAQAMQGSKEWMVRRISRGCFGSCSWVLSASAAS